MASFPVARCLLQELASLPGWLPSSILYEGDIRVMPAVIYQDVLFNLHTLLCYYFMVEKGCCRQML